MPVTSDRAAPYAPAKTILDIVGRFRDRGIPLPINTESLGRISVPETLLPRVLQSLRTLDLITDDGQPTPILEGISLAPEVEYKKRLEDWLKGTYADIFLVVDPAKDDETRIRDAFRGYMPHGQQTRMVTLFVGLCAAAGLMPEKTVRAAPQASSAPQSRPSVERVVKKLIRSQHRSTPESMTASTGLPSPLAGLLAKLPPDGKGWTKPRRDSFVTTFSAVLDFCFPIEEHEPDEDEEAA
jgi:hypothetical protein